MQTALQDLDEIAFSRFGSIVDAPSRNHDAAGPGWSWWAETAFLPSDARPYGIGYLTLEPVPLVFDWAERHLRTMEMIIPVRGDCVIHVAPANPSTNIDRDPRPEEFQAFRIRQGQAVILKPGVWHAAPFALQENSAALVLLLEHTGRDDLTLVRFPDTPVTISQ